jgi:hypothetical protein
MSIILDEDMENMVRQFRASLRFVEITIQNKGIGYDFSGFKVSLGNLMWRINQLIDCGDQGDIELLISMIISAQLIVDQVEQQIHFAEAWYNWEQRNINREKEMKRVKENVR